MSVIIRLQNLPISAKSGDIRHFFRGLRIPDGGVHIIGGDKGIVFVAFKSDEDARIAMRKDGWKINNNKIKLYLSSHMEMMHEIEQLMKRGSANVFQSQTSFNKYSSPNRTITKDVDKAANYNIKDYLSYSSDEDNKTPTYEMVHSTRRDRSSLSPRSQLMEESHSLMQRSHSSNLRSRSPNIQEESFLREDSRAEVMQRSRSPYIRRSQSPYDGRSRSPYTRRIQSPNIRRSRSPYAERSRSPFLGRSQLSYVRRSPSEKRSLSPHVKMSELQYMRSPSPFLRRSRSPLTKRSGSPCVRSRSPFERRSQSPHFKRSWSSKGRDSPIYSTSFEKSKDIGSAYNIESDRCSTKNDRYNYISDPLFRSDTIENNSYTKFSANEEQRQLEEKISKALNTRFVENAFGMTSEDPVEDSDISRTITQHIPDYYKNQQIPFINDFNSPETSKVTDVNEQYQPFNSISDNISLNISSNSDQQNFYENPRLPPFQDQRINMLPTAPSSSISSVSMFPQSHELHPAPTMPMSTTQNFQIPFTGYYITISGLDPFWTDGELQIMLKGIFAPQGNIRWEINDNGFKTGVAFVKILNKDDFNQMLMYPTFVYNNRVISVNECPNYIYEKYFPPPIVPPLPEQMIVKDGDLYYKMKALPYSVTIEEIMQFFYGFHIADLYIEEIGGKRSGIGYIGFATIADYDRARIMHNKKMQHMFVQIIPCSKQDMLNAKTKLLGYFNPTSQPGATYNSTSTAVPKRRLCATITGVPSFVKIPRLQNFFKEKGLTPHAIHIIVNNQRKSLGRGFVEFSNIRDFDAALKSHGEVVANKMICVKQILYDEMIKILGANKTRHYYAEDDHSNLFPIEKEPEKAPYIWDPPDQDSSPQKSLNEFHQYNTFNTLPSNNINVCNTDMQYGNLETGINNYNYNVKRNKSKRTSEYRNPVRFEVKIKPLNTKADGAFDKTNKEDIPQKLTKLTPEKEKLNNKNDSVLIKNEKKIAISGKEKDQKYKFTKPILQNVDGAKKIQDTAKIDGVKKVEGSSNVISKLLSQNDGVKKMEGASKIINKPTVQKDGVKKIEGASKVISNPTVQKDGVKKMEGASKVISKPTLQKEEVRKTEGASKVSSKSTLQKDGGVKKMESSSKIINKPKVQKDVGSKQKSNRLGNTKIIRGNDSRINRESRGKYSPLRRRSPSPRRGNRRQYSPNFKRDSFEYRRNISPDQSREVVIQMSNVHPLIGESELRAFFHGFDILEKMSRRYGANGEPLGDIRVTLTSRQEAERALKYLDGLTLNGMHIHMMIVD